MRTQNSEMRKKLRDIHSCELCGSSRSLEVHHIIPVVCGIDENDPDNMIVICSKCHALLTPKNILTKLGIRNRKEKNKLLLLKKSFYEKVAELTEIIGRVDACDVMDAFDQIDVLCKSAKIYISAKCMGFTPEGMSDEQMAEMSRAFNLPK